MAKSDTSPSFLDSALAASALLATVLLSTASCQGDSTPGVALGPDGAPAAGGATSGSGGAAATGDCPAGQSSCDGACVDLSSDPNNCGACGAACTGTGQQCSGGTCICPIGTQDCGEDCVDTLRSNTHCGGCNNTCGPDDYCNQGSCEENPCWGQHEYPCESPTSCSNTWFDNNHCGECGNACVGNQWCENGRCRCAQDHLLCDGQCVHVLSSIDHCGFCGNACVGNQWCAQGTCTCAQGQVLCGGNCHMANECESITGTSGDPGTGSGTGGPAGPSTVTPGVTVSDFCGSTSLRTGKSTWYQLATPQVHCSYPSNSLPQYYAAMNDADYGVADVCGACVEIHSGGQTLQVQIVDECPFQGNEAWCWPGSNHIDLNQAAFQQFAGLEVGVLDIQWRYVPCANPGTLSYAFKDGSSVWWTGVLIRNSPVPITKVEYANASGTWKSLVHVEYNYWLDEAGFGQGPYSLRITDVTGAVVVQEGIPSLGGDPVQQVTFQQIGVQFPGC